MTKIADIGDVAVVGAGWMGSGIATVCAIGGYVVNLVDTSQDILDRCRAKIRQNLELLTEGQEISDSDAGSAFDRVRTTSNLPDGLSGAGLAIEAVPEKIEIKQEVFERMEGAALPGTILASNASRLPTTQIAARCSHPELVVGMHFFEPPLALRAVEVIRGQHTSDDTFQKAQAFVQSLGWVPIRILKDRESFAINFLQGAMRRAVQDLVDAGVTTEEEVIKAARHSFGIKYVAMGPVSSRGGVDRSRQYEPEAIQEMNRRTLAMLSIARTVRSLEST